MKALILAGGKGTRLRPITYEIPKPLMPIHGRPIMAHLLELFQKYKITDIILSVGYLKEMIKDYFKDGSQYGLRISYVEEDGPLGTAGPIKLANRLGLLSNKIFIVSNGDELKEIDIKEIVNFHKKNKVLATIALTQVEDPAIYGVAEMKGNKIIRFVEKPKPGEAPSNLINAGFYILDPRIIDLIPDGLSMLEKDVFPKLAVQGRLAGFHFKGQWFDTGNMERYEKAIKEWKG